MLARTTYSDQLLGCSREKSHQAPDLILAPLEANTTWITTPEAEDSNILSRLLHFAPARNGYYDVSQDIIKNKKLNMKPIPNTTSAV